MNLELTDSEAERLLHHLNEANAIISFAARKRAAKLYEKAEERTWISSCSGAEAPKPEG